MIACQRRAGARRLCTAHHPGTIQTRGSTYRAECSCGWSTPWWGSLLSLLSDVHAHRYPRRGARRLGA